MCKQVLNKPLLRLRNKTHWTQTLYSLVKLPLWVQRFSLQERGVCLSRADQSEEKMESPPRLGLGTISMTPLRGRTNLTIKVWVQSLGMGMGRCQAPNPTRPVGRLPIIMSYVLISLKAHSILLSILTYILAYIQQSIIPNSNMHLSWQLTLSLAYIYHAYHIISSKATNNKISQGQKHKHGNIKETSDCILDIKNTSFNQACSTHH